MKLKFKAPEKRASATKLSAAVDNFNGALDQVNEVLVERESEVNALKLCLIAQEHIMLQGEPGIAKSMFAREVFQRIQGFRMFKKQFTSTTQPDEVLGCMDSKVYREQAVWKYNIKGMLPDAHGAFLDEVYRAAKSFLSNLMQILNERTFFNGTEEVECPLVTAIGTTNFTLHDDELEAFRDRWLVNLNTKRLSGMDPRLTVFERFLISENGKVSTKDGSVKTVTFEELKMIQDAATSVPISRAVLEAFDGLFRTYLNYQKNSKISDRRLCQILKLFQAAFILSNPKEGEAMSEEVLVHAQMGFCSVGDEAQNEHFNQAFEKVVGERLKDRAMVVKLQKLQKHVKGMEVHYDSNMSPKVAKTVYVESLRYLDAIKAYDKSVLRAENQRILLDCGRRLECLVNDVRGIVSKSIQEEVEDSVDLDD